MKIKNKEVIEMEMRSLIESCMITLTEHKRIMSNKKEEVSEYEKGRTDGILLVGKDFIENFIRFADRIGVSLKQKEVGGTE